MKKRLTALVSAVVMAGLLASCGGKKNTPAAEAGNAQGSAKKGSVVHVQIGPSPETIDPALNSAVDGANMIIHAFEGLLKFDRNNNIVAQRWLSVSVL